MSDEPKRPTPIRDAFERLGFDMRPLPPDHEVYRSGPLVFIPPRPRPEPPASAEQEDRDARPA
jgi:hypothetical protein